MHMTCDCTLGNVIHRIKAGMSFYEIMTFETGAAERKRMKKRNSADVYDPTDIASDREALSGATPEQKRMMAQWDAEHLKAEDRRGQAQEIHA